jgi:hypothetical protein
VAVRFHIDGHDRSLDEDDALVLSHFLRAHEPGLAEAVRAAATALPANTAIRIDEDADARALVVAAQACGDLIRTPELERLRLAAEVFLAGR